jgi:uncharacterized SAM-dependent methyltransferase
MFPQYRLCEYGMKYGNKTKALFWFFYQRENELCYVVEDLDTGIIHDFNIQMDLNFLDTTDYVPDFEI